MNTTELEIAEILHQAERNLETGRIQMAKKRVEEAIQTAKKAEKYDLIGMILKTGVGKHFCYTTPQQSVKLESIKCDGWILDIGGGGEGIIGKLNGKQVVAIDLIKRELQETKNDALKIVMDAAELKFLPETFDVCTSFFSLMYIPEDKLSRVLEEAHRVLKEEGRLVVWDVKIDKEERPYMSFVVRLKVKLPREEIQVVYGAKWRLQNCQLLKEMAQEAGFEAADEWTESRIFHLEMIKA